MGKSHLGHPHFVLSNDDCCSIVLSLYLLLSQPRCRQAVACESRSAPLGRLCPRCATRGLEEYGVIISHYCILVNPIVQSCLKINRIKSHPVYYNSLCYYDRRSRLLSLTQIPFISGHFWILCLVRSPVLTEYRDAYHLTIIKIIFCFENSSTISNVCLIK